MFAFFYGAALPAAEGLRHCLVVLIVCCESWLSLISTYSFLPARPASSQPGKWLNGLVLWALLCPFWNEAVEGALRLVQTGKKGSLLKYCFVNHVSYVILLN